jgi:hypothetical protein
MGFEPLPTAAMIGGRRQLLALGDEVVVELAVEPAQPGQLGQRVDRPGGLPVNEGDQHALAGDDVPRRHVAVAGGPGGACAMAMRCAHPSRG